MIKSFQAAHVGVVRSQWQQKPSGKVYIRFEAALQWPDGRIVPIGLQRTEQARAEADLLDRLQDCSEHANG